MMFEILFNASRAFYAKNYCPNHKIDPSANYTGTLYIKIDIKSSHLIFVKNCHVFFLHTHFYHKSDTRLPPTLLE